MILCLDRNDPVSIVCDFQVFLELLIKYYLSLSKMIIHHVGVQQWAVFTVQQTTQIGGEINIIF